MSEALQTVEPQQLAATTPMSIDVGALKRRVADIEAVIDGLMVKGTHYGEPYPGCKKESLLQAGAEILLIGFSMVAEPEITEERMDGDHRRFICSGWIMTGAGARVGFATAESSTMEPTYRWRKGGRACPDCESTAIMKSKYPDRDTGVKGWWCNVKAGGCGANFPPDAPEILEQQTGRIENPDLAELWHTCRRMAEKRWMVALTRRTFGLSARFVDEDGAQAARFDLGRAKGLLRALTGEKEAKWQRCIGWCLQEFGKAPRDLTNLEGDVFLRWLGEQIDDASRLTPADFGESPELERNGNGVAPAPAVVVETPPAPKQAARELSSAELSAQLEERAALEELTKAVRGAKIETDVEQKFGPPSDWLASRSAILDMVVEVACADDSRTD